MQGKKFHLVMRQEGKYYITRILENNISSFWSTEKEALENTREALDLYYEEAHDNKHSCPVFENVSLTSYSYA